MFKKDSEIELGHDCIPRVLCTVCNDATTVYLFTNFASLACGKERPPRVEIMYCGLLLINASSVSAAFKI